MYIYVDLEKTDTFERLTFSSNYYLIYNFQMTFIIDSFILLELYINE